MATEAVLALNALPDLHLLDPVQLAADTVPNTSTSAPTLENGLLEGVQWINWENAKSVLKREIVEWLKTGFATKLLSIQTIQVTFTKCGRYGVLVGRARTGQFGLRLVTLDPHHRLCTYLLGVSLTLESALLHSAARIKAIDDDMDRLDREMHHGDVVHVDHIGYAHVAVYDAVDEVFYELIGDYESGYDALVAHPAAMASEKAKEVHDQLQAATRSQLTAALAFFRHEVDRFPATKGKPVTESDTIAEGLRADISTSSGLPPPTISLRGSRSSNTASPNSTTPLSTSSGTTFTVEGSMPVLEPKPVFILPTEANKPLESRRPSGTLRRLAASSSVGQSAVQGLERERLRASSSESDWRRERVASILAASGHVFMKNSAFSDDTLGESLIMSKDEEQYDAPMHLQVASDNLRKLAASSDDIGLTKLLAEDEDGFTAVGADASIQPDDMCPAMAFSFPSHSIAEVQATPKDAWLTRDPFLHKHVVYYPNALAPEVVIARAKSAVGSPGWNPITRNCEHFATWAKTGRTISTQLYEVSSTAAFVGASSLQTVITLAFIGLVSLWVIGNFATASPLMETFETIFTWLLKGGVVVSSIIFALGIFMHWQNGKGADFDEWAAKKRTEVPIDFTHRPIVETKPTAQSPSDGAASSSSNVSNPATPTVVSLTNSQ